MYHIVHVLYSGLGGHAGVCFSLVEADQSRQHRHTFVFYGNTEVPREYLEKCRKLGVEYVYFPKNPGLDLGTQYKIARFINRHPVNLLVSHRPQLILLRLLWRNKCRNAKMLVVEHNANDLKSTANWILDTASLILADKVVFLTHTYKQQVRKKLRFFFFEKKSVVIPNGVNIRQFSPAAQASGNPYKQGVVVIGMATRITGGKDLHTLFAGLKLLKEQHSHCRICFRLAGTGPLLEELVNYAREHEIDSEFTGLLAEKPLVEFYRSLHIYVHATKHETMSTSIIQAMSCGLPIVSNDISGMRDLVKPEFGILVPPEKPEELASAILDLCQNKEKRSAFGQKAREHCIEHLSHTKSFERYLATLVQE